MKELISSIILLFITTVVFSQNTITGSFPPHASQQIKIVGFEGFETYAIDSVKTNDKGVFELSFSKNDYGMGYLVAEDNMPFVVVLSGEDIKLQGESLLLPKRLK